MFVTKNLNVYSPVGSTKSPVHFVRPYNHIPSHAALPDVSVPTGPRGMSVTLFAVIAGHGNANFGDSSYGHEEAWRWYRSGHPPFVNAPT